MIISIRHFKSRVLIVNEGGMTDLTRILLVAILIFRPDRGVLASTIYENILNRPKVFFEELCQTFDNSLLFLQTAVVAESGHGRHNSVDVCTSSF